MKITIARTAGFCMGVRRAVELALDASNRTSEPIYTYGPLIHNPQVLDILKEKGISVISQIPEKGDGTVLIRAHGVPPGDRDALKNAGFTVLDATCPKVIKVQAIIARHARQGEAVIIIGDRAHPEVIGLLGYAGEHGHVAENMAELKNLPPFEKAIIVAQTTQNKDFFTSVVDWAKTTHPHYQVFNTICDSTESRQADVKNLAGKVDAVVVVGGRESGNTQRLFDIARKTGKPAVHIETEAELDLNQLGNARHIGITAGASTPNWIIKRVYRDLENRLIYKGSRFRRCQYLIHRHLLLSNIYLALAAGSLTYASSVLQGIAPSILSICMASLYLLCMHTFNNLMDVASDRYNDPDRAAFYQKNRWLISAVMVLSGLGGMAAAFMMRPLFLVLFLCMGFMGIVYIISLMPRRINGRFQPKIREIPGSKTVFAALAWGIVTALVPALYGLGQIKLITILAFVWATSLIFVRTAFFDILDMQGSRIVGKETIPILLGEKKTMALLKILSGMMVALMCLASITGAVSSLGYLLCLCPLSILLFLSIHERGAIYSGLRQGVLMEGHFILTGLLAFLWTMV